MKKIVLLTFLILIINITYSQKDSIFHDAGFYNTIQWSGIEETTITPQAWIYIKNCYLEARYNYEDNKTISLYVGRAFQIKNGEITPMIAAVVGKTMGVSHGINFEFKHNAFSTFTQCQYTFNLRDNNKSFFWDWSGFNFDISKYFGLGGAFQVLKQNGNSPLYKVAPMISFRHKLLIIEVYTYNLWQKYPIGAVGIEYSFQ